jgi:hypothetical protein
MPVTPNISQTAKQTVNAKVVTPRTTKLRDPDTDTSAIFAPWRESQKRFVSQAEPLRWLPPRASLIVRLAIKIMQ